MPLFLYCKACWEAFTAAGTLPPVCPSCKSETTWTSFYEPPETYPKRKWTLTDTDRRFLKMLRIDGETN